MSWDARGQHGPYFYRSMRVGQRVLKVYAGRGQQAEELARQIEQRKHERQAVQKELNQAAVAEQRLQELQDVADLLMRAVFMRMGLHEHRGQWRKRRYGKEDHDDTDH
jgi:Fe2+ transport system protein B